MRLRTLDAPIPGGYPFEQRGDKPRKFRSEPLAEAQARIVWSYRMSNGLSRATYVESLVDVISFQCERLGNNPRYCIEENPDQPNAIPLADNAAGLAPCSGCGAKVE